ncbi:homocysteine S-methyltransferase family protein [Wenyingzhuangia sp. IMCC45574]
MADIREELKKRILVLDGAMGTMIQQYKFTEEDYRGEQFKDWHVSVKGNNDMLSITQPEAIKEIHAKYFKAGADIAETNTFSSTTIAMADYEMEDAVYQLNYESAKIAKEVADEFTAKEPHKPRFVAGSVGPTNRTLSMSPDVNDPGYRAVTFDELRIAYKQQVEALIDGGVDVLLVETIFDTLNAKAALFAIQEVNDEKGLEVPIMVSGTITDASGRTLSGQTAEAFLISVSHLPLLTVGFNCALGADALQPHLESVASNTKFGVSAHPNAGLPNAFGEYDETPEEMAVQIQKYFDKGLINIIGGCCGTTPAHIRAIADIAEKVEPRQVK